MSNKNKGLRETMPTVAGWVDDLRAAFGADSINASIKNGMAGGTDFWASENGTEIGNRLGDEGLIWSDKMNLRKTDPKTCDCPVCKQARLAGMKGSPWDGRGRA